MDSKFLRVSDECKFNAVKFAINKAHSSGSTVYMSVLVLSPPRFIHTFPNMELDTALFQQHQDGVLGLQIDNKAGHFVDFDFADLKIFGEMPVEGTTQLAKFSIPIQSVILVGIQDMDNKVDPNNYFITASFQPYIVDIDKRIYMDEHQTLN